MENTSYCAACAAPDLDRLATAAEQAVKYLERIAKALEGLDRDGITVFNAD